MRGAIRRLAAGGNGWPLVAAGTALIAVSYGLARYAYGLYLPRFRAEFALSASTAGTLASVSYASYCLAIFLGAAFTARGAARGTAILAGATATVGMGLVAVSRSTKELGIGVAIAGASAGLSSPPLVALVASGVRPAFQNRAQTVVNAGTGLGVLVAGPSALALATQWRWSWVLFAALSLAVTVAIATTTRAVQNRPAGTGRLPRRRARRSIAARSALGAAAFGLGLASSAYWTFGRDLLAASGTPTNAAVAAWIALGATSILASVTGDLVARYRIDLVWASLLLMLSVATAGLAVEPRALPIVFASAVLFGASYVALTGILILWASRLMPHQAAAAVGATFLLLSAGQLVGATLTGVLVDHAGWTASFLTAAASALALMPLAATPRRNASTPRPTPPAEAPATHPCP
jgi:predicted MFS family arabinose efflux permease